jgi:hypothetical protein
MGGHMNFSERFKEICKEIKRNIPNPEEEPPRPAVLHNIHKRSLPVGLDRPVMFGLAKEEAQYLLKHYLKTKVITTDERDSIIYYDVVKDNGELAGVFDNPKVLFIDEN